MNRIEIIGNVGKEADVRQIGERFLLNFHVAVTRSYKDKDGEQRKETTWFNCYYWCNTDKLAQYITKGKLMFIEGEMRCNEHTDSNGVKGFIWFISVNNVIFLGSDKHENLQVKVKGEDLQSTKVISSPTEIADAIGGDLPF